jgi:hypothetical protein
MSLLTMMITKYLNNALQFTTYRINGQTDLMEYFSGER